MQSSSDQHCASASTSANAPAAAAWSYASRANRRGLTLLELMIVMAIVGLVFGLGVRAFRGMDLGRGADGSLLRGALREARSAAVAERQPASVVVATDPVTARVTLSIHSMRTLGTWHFERPDGRGTDDLTAAPVRGARQIDDGHIGRALGFRGAGREARADIALETIPTYDLREGFSIELMARLEDVGGGTLFRLGTRINVAGLESMDGGGLRGWVAPSYTDATGRELVGGRIDVQLPPGTLIAGRWTRLTLSYDRVQLRLVVDDFLAGVVPATGPLAALEDGLVLGGAPFPFPGSIDTLIVRGAQQTDPLPLSQNLDWPDSLPRRILFDADGSLDTVVHGGQPLELELPSEVGRPIFVSRLGVIE